MFTQILNFEDTQFDNIGDEEILCQSIEDSVTDALQTLKKEMGESWYDATFANDIPEIKEQLVKQYLIHEEEILLFCYGHGVEKFIKSFMVKLIEILRKLKMEEVKRTLSKSSKDVIVTKLNDSFKFLLDKNAQMKKIKGKLANELN